jgi:hypothetical protein
VASKRSAQNPFQWSNGTWHSRPEGKEHRSTYTPPKAPGPAKLTPAGPQYDPAQQPAILPLDPAAEAARVAGQRNLGISEADAVYDTGQIENEYGLGLDKSNPYSRARLLEESYKRSQRGTLNSAGNQLYSGAYQRMQGENTRNYSMGYDQLSRDYGNQLRNVQRGRLQSYANYGTGMDQAEWERLLRAYTGG